MQENDFSLQQTETFTPNGLCKRINVLKYNAEVTVKPFRQYSNRKTPLWSQKMVAKTLPTDSFSLNFRGTVLSAIFHTMDVLLHSRVQ